MTTWDIPKEVGLFHVILLTEPLYNQWYQFITVRVTLSIPYHRVTLIVMSILKRFCLNLLYNVILRTLNDILVSHPNKLRIIQTFFKLRLSKSTLKETQILWFQLYVASPIIISQLVHQQFGHVPNTRLQRTANKGIMESTPMNIHELEQSCPICLQTKETKIYIGPNIEISSFAPGFVLQMDSSYFNVESIGGFISKNMAICSTTV